MTINAGIHRHIRTLVNEFAEPSRSRMRLKMRNDRAAARELGTAEADAAVRHTYHEFLVGRHLQRIGLSPEYNRSIAGKTPDWFDARARLLVEVFSVDGGTTDASSRVISRLAKKLLRYAPMVQAESLSFVIAVHGDDQRLFTVDRLEDVLKNNDLFVKTKDLSGVLFVGEEAEQARPLDGRAFTYLPNPHAARPISHSLSSVQAAR
jgi:hypothetical protein